MCAPFHLFVSLNACCLTERQPARLTHFTSVLRSSHGESKSFFFVLFLSRVLRKAGRREIVRFIPPMPCQSIFRRENIRASFHDESAVVKMNGSRKHRLADVGSFPLKAITRRDNRAGFSACDE